jgi:AraC family transcriptional activator of mtrCDE
MSSRLKSLLARLMALEHTLVRLLRHPFLPGNYMEALDRLIQLSRLQGALDLRCLLSGEWTLDHPPAPPSEAVYHVVLAGSCLLKFRGQADVRLETGDIVMLPRGDAHVLQGEESSDQSVPREMESHYNGAVTVRTNCGPNAASLDLLCGKFNYAANALLIDVLPDIVKMSFERDDVPDLTRMVGMMRRESSEAGPGAHSIISAFSTALFTMLLRAHLAQQPSKADVLALLAHPRLGSSVIAMLERPAEKWTIEMLAQQSAMSRATYARAFGALTEDSPMTLLTRIRMQLAGMLLTRTAKSIAEIADDVGYQSESAFSKKFKDTYGVGPGAYRQARAGG